MSEVSRCRACGAFIQGKDRFCWSCGFDLVPPPAESSAASPLVDRGRLDHLDNAVGLVLRRAHLAQRRGQLGEALRLVREALEEDSNSVPALTLLAELLRATGDYVGAVEASQQASQVAAGHGAPAGALRRAREERAAIEQQVAREVAGNSVTSIAGALARLTGSGTGGPALAGDAGGAWYHSAGFYLLIALLGLGGLFLGVVALLRGALLGYIWFAAALVAAGWCYHDAETRHQPGLFWAPVVLCLGPFGLAIYLLSRY